MELWGPWQQQRWLPFSRDQFTCAWENCTLPSGDQVGGKLLQNSCSTGFCLVKLSEPQIDLFDVVTILASWWHCADLAINQTTKVKSTCCDLASWGTLSASHLHCHINIYKYPNIHKWVRTLHAFVRAEELHLNVNPDKHTTHETHWAVKNITLAKMRGHRWLAVSWELWSSMSAYLLRKLGEAMYLLDIGSRGE